MKKMIVMALCLMVSNAFALDYAFKRIEFKGTLKYASYRGKKKAVKSGKIEGLFAVNKLNQAFLEIDGNKVDLEDHSFQVFDEKGKNWTVSISINQDTFKKMVEYANQDNDIYRYLTAEVIGEAFDGMDHGDFQIDAHSFKDRDLQTRAGYGDRDKKDLEYSETFFTPSGIHAMGIELKFGKKVKFVSVVK